MNLKKKDVPGSKFHQTKIGLTLLICDLLVEFLGFNISKFRNFKNIEIIY